MTEETKLTLSAKELELVCNSEWILTKHRIIEKVYDLFGVLADQMKLHVAEDAPSLFLDPGNSNAKISRGENYLGLPYVMLDYPRNFSRESTLAIRTFFWWGNSFSIHLQLSGSYQKKGTSALDARYKYLRENDFYICVNSDPWQHHFKEDNYVLVNKISAGEFSLILNRESFVKIAKNISLDQWESVPSFINKSFKEMIKILGTNFPGDEKDL